MIRCATCSACEPLNVKTDTGVKVAGTCHALPPIAIQREEGLSFTFPMVNPTVMWCRMWEPRQGFDADGERTDQLTPEKPKLILEN